MRCTARISVSVFGLLVCGLVVPSASAAPYASRVTKTGVDVSFILNEPADTLTYSINGGAAQTLDATTKGTKSFVLGNASDTFSITASKNATLGYTIPTGGTVPITGAFQSLSQVSNEGGYALISDDANPLYQFNSPRGVGVGQDPNAPNFGVAYVGNSAVATAGRLIGDGIYAVNADGTDAFGYGDTAQNPPLPDNAPAFIASTNSPYRVFVGKGGTVYVSDFADANSNVMALNPTLTAGTPLLSGFNGGALQPGENHGSVSGFHVTGSLETGDLVLYSMDEDLTTAQVTGNGADPVNDRNSVWKYEIGSGPTPYAAMPTKVGTGLLGTTGALATFTDMDRGTDGKIYLSQTRSAGGESGIIVVDGSGNQVFNSLDASRTLLNNPAAVDIMTTVNMIAVSPDQKYLAALLNYSDVAILPLVNGIPDLANRLVVNSGSVNSARDIAFDAAGNIHFVSSGEARYRVIAPGGNTTAITSWDGNLYDFEITTATAPEGIIGDFNDDGDVDAADYTVWRDNLGSTVVLPNDDSPGTVDNSDYSDWVTNFGMSGGSGAIAGGAVPEPASAGLLLIGLIGIGCSAVRRRQS